MEALGLLKPSIFRPKAHRIRIAMVGILASVGLGLWAAPATLAYNPTAAAAYADQWVLSSSWCSGRTCFSNDCANFVSYALHYGGGYAFAGYPTGSHTDDHNWYVWQDPRHLWEYTHSWSVARDLYTFQMWHYPGGWLEGTVGGATVYMQDGLIPGDLVFFDWDGVGGIDHVAIQVAYGTDQNSGYTGDLVDAHSSNRYHAIWSLYPYNSQWRTTTIYKVAVYSGN